MYIYIWLLDIIRSHKDALFTSNVTSFFHTTRVVTLCAFNLSSVQIIVKNIYYLKWHFSSSYLKLRTLPSLLSFVGNDKRIATGRWIYDQQINKIFKYDMLINQPITSDDHGELLIFGDFFLINWHLLYRCQATLLLLR